MMALFTTIPKRARTPISAGKDKDTPVNPKITNTPLAAGGIVRRTSISVIRGRNNLNSCSRKFIFEDVRDYVLNSGHYIERSV